MAALTFHAFLSLNWGPCNKNGDQKTEKGPHGDPNRDPCGYSGLIRKHMHTCQICQDTHRIHMGGPWCCLSSKGGDRGSHWAKRCLSQGWFNHLGKFNNSMKSSTVAPSNPTFTRVISIPPSTSFQHHSSKLLQINYMRWSQDCHIPLEDVGLVIGQDDRPPRGFHHQRLWQVGDHLNGLQWAIWLFTTVLYPNLTSPLMDVSCMMQATW